MNDRENLVRLKSSGEIVNLLTSRGANSYLLEITRVDDFAFFSADLQTASNIRKKGTKKKRINASDRQVLCQIYDKISNLAEYSDPRLFRQLVPESEITAVMNHFVEIYQARATDPAWINSGDMLKHDFPSLACMFALFKHPVPVAMVLLEENSLLETLTNMMAARHGNKNKLLPTEFAEAVIIMVSNLIDCSMVRFDNPWTAEKVFKKIDSIGFLEQYLRCTALPASGDVIDDAKAQTFDTLLTCTAFVNKRFKNGTPCGDTVRSLLTGKGGRPAVHHRALPYFRSLVQLSELLQPDDTIPEATYACFCCKKKDSRDKLLTCSRCRKATYCSKKCQKQDWKEHKQNCSEPQKSSAMEKNKAALNQAIMNIVNRNYTRMMLKMVEVLDEADLQVYDVMLELDFTPDSSGKVPVLQDPPAFDIIPISRYLEEGEMYRGHIFEFTIHVGSEVTEQDNEEERKFREQVENIITHLKDRLARKIPNELLCFVKRKDATSFVTLDHKDEESGRPFFSMEAVNGFRSAMLLNDYAPLSRIFVNEEKFEKLVANLQYLLQENAE